MLASTEDLQFEEFPSKFGKPSFNFSPLDKQLSFVMEIPEPFVQCYF